MDLVPIHEDHHKEIKMEGGETNPWIIKGSQLASYSPDKDRFLMEAEGNSSQRFVTMARDTISTYDNICGFSYTCYLRLGNSHLWSSTKPLCK